VADVLGLEGDETGSITPMLGPIPEMAPINTPIPAHLERPAGDVPEMEEEPKEPTACDTLQELLPPSVVLGFISALCAALYTTGTKVATDQRLSPGSHISVPFLLLLRGIVGLPLVLYEAYGLEGQSFPPGKPEQLPLMITSGVMAMLGTALGLFATSMWGNASVACIVNTSPALTVIITAIVCIPDLHEALNLQSCIMLVIALTGMVFVTRPEFIWGDSKDASDVGYIPPLAALGQASFQSITALMIRKIPGKPSAASITFYVQVSMLFFGLALSCYDVYDKGEKISVNWDSPAGPITGMLLFAVCGTGANYFKNKALRLSKSVLVVGLRFFTPIICYIADLCIMQANPNYHIHSDIYSYIGCALIISAGVLLLLLKRQREASGVSTVSDGGTTPPVPASPAKPEDEPQDKNDENQPLLGTTEKESS
jgi:drug/metabolite transporter (DMT)-like permease